MRRRLNGITYTYKDERVEICEQCVYQGTNIDYL